MVMAERATEIAMGQKNDGGDLTGPIQERGLQKALYFILEGSGHPCVLFNYLISGRLGWDDFLGVFFQKAANRHFMFKVAAVVQDQDGQFALVNQVH